MLVEFGRVSQFSSGRAGHVVKRQHPVTVIHTHKQATRAFVLILVLVLAVVRCITAAQVQEQSYSVPALETAGGQHCSAAGTRPRMTR